jgi:hypothetical protein
MLLGKARVIRVMLAVCAAPKTRRQSVIVLSLYAASGSAIRVRNEWHCRLSLLYLRRFGAVAGDLPSGIVAGE